MQAMEARPRVSTRSSVWFSIAFVFAVFLTFCTSLWLASLPALVKQTDSAAGYGHRAAGIACEVLIYGDSTAEYGINPFVIERTTGLKACDIAEARPTEDFVGTFFPVDDYLAHNPPPRYLLTTWTTADLHLDRTPSFTDNADGFDYAIRYDRGPWLWRGMLLHPGDTLSLVAFESREIMGAVRRVFTFRGKQAEGVRAVRDRQRGWLEGSGPGQTACVGVPKFDVPSTYALNRQGVEAFRKRYEARGIKVIIDVSPAADCVTNLQQNLASIRGLYDNRFEALPINNFVDRDVHLFGKSATHYSEETASQILALLKEEHGTKL